MFLELWNLIHTENEMRERKLNFRTKGLHQWLSAPIFNGARFRITICQLMCQ